MGMEIRPFFKDEYTEPKVWFWFGFLVAFYTVQPGSYSNDRRSGSPRRLWASFMVQNWVWMMRSSGLYFKIIEMIIEIRSQSCLLLNGLVIPRFRWTGRLQVPRNWNCHPAWLKFLDLLRSRVYLYYQKIICYCSNLNQSILITLSLASSHLHHPCDLAVLDFQQSAFQSWLVSRNNAWKKRICQ